MKQPLYLTPDPWLTMAPGVTFIFYDTLAVMLPLRSIPLTQRAQCLNSWLIKHRTQSSMTSKYATDHKFINCTHITVIILPLQVPSTAALKCVWLNVLVDVPFSFFFWCCSWLHYINFRTKWISVYFFFWTPVCEISKPLHWNHFT